MRVMNRAAESLRAWLEREERSQAWLSIRVGAHQTRISALLRGDTEPRASLASAIETVTGIPTAWWSPEERSAPDDTGPIARPSSQAQSATGTDGPSRPLTPIESAPTDPGLIALLNAASKQK